MKRTFCLLLAFFVATSSFAQKFEFGLSGGIADYSLHDITVGNTVYGYSRYQQSIISPLVGIKAIYNYKKFQAGVEAGYRTLKYNSLVSPKDPFGLEIYPEIQYKDQEQPVKLFVNRTFKFSHFQAYAGLFATYVFVNSQSQIIEPPGGRPFTSQNSGRTTGGVQCGVTYFVTKKWGVNAEVAGEYNSFPGGPLDNNIFSFPLTIGVRYRF